MSEIAFSFIPKDKIACVLPLLEKISSEKNQTLLHQRLMEMTEQNYRCLGIYTSGDLIGICGLWFMTRHYCGRTVEPDHVYIDDAYQGKGIGKQLFEWLFQYCRERGINATELNSYVENTRSHKFYKELGYEILGFHFLKIIE